MRMMKCVCLSVCDVDHHFFLYSLRGFHHAFSVAIEIIHFRGFLWCLVRFSWVLGGSLWSSIGFYARMTKYWSKEYILDQNFRRLVMSSLIDKPARLSFFCSLDLLLISDQTNTYRDIREGSWLFNHSIRSRKEQ